LDLALGVPLVNKLSQHEFKNSGARRIDTQLGNLSYGIFLTIFAYAVLGSECALHTWGMGPTFVGQHFAQRIDPSLDRAVNFALAKTMASKWQNH
jgi:hypothetical protein